MKSGKTRFLAIILFFFSAVTIYYLYVTFFHNKQSSNLVIGEETGEYKKKPIDPGGIVVPNSNSLIYEKLDKNNVKSQSTVNIIEEPEQPVSLPFKRTPQSLEEYDSIDDILAKIDLSEEDSTSVLGTFSELSDRIFAEPLANKQGISPEETEPLKEEDKQFNQDFNGLRITILPEENNKLVKLSTNSLDSGYKIQLASSWSEKEARNEWQKIQSRHRKYLKNAHLSVKKVKTDNGKIIYLVTAGNYSSLAQAKLVCKKLILSKQNCIVTK